MSDLILVMIFPVFIPLLFPGFFVVFIAASTFGAWWPTRVTCAIFRLTPVLLIERGDVTAGFLRRNAIGVVIAYEGFLPIFGHRATEDGRVNGAIFSTKWIPMPRLFSGVPPASQRRDL